ncbi:MAG: hypothetical protein AAF804_15525, partial [Bacteroidota bacterium]
FSAQTQLTFAPANQNEIAGLIIYRNSTHHLQLVKAQGQLLLRRHEGGRVDTVAQIPFSGAGVQLKVEADGLAFRCFYAVPGGTYQALGAPQPMRLISDEAAGGFNGPFVGLYASSQGQPSKSEARVEYFEYQGK